jgi:hypothetical protein
MSVVSIACVVVAFLIYFVASQLPLPRVQINQMQLTALSSVFVALGRPQLCQNHSAHQCTTRLH